MKNIHYWIPFSVNQLSHEGGVFSFSIDFGWSITLMRGKVSFLTAHLASCNFLPEGYWKLPLFLHTPIMLHATKRAAEFVFCQGCHCLRLREPHSPGPLVTRLLILQPPSLAAIVRLHCVCVWCLSGCVVIGSCSAVWDSAGWSLHVNPSFLSGIFPLWLYWELYVRCSWWKCTPKFTWRLLRPDKGEW